MLVVLILAASQAQAQITAADLDDEIDVVEYAKEGNEWLTVTYFDNCALHPKNSQQFQTNFNLCEQFWTDAQYYSTLLGMLQTARAQDPPNGDYTDAIEEAADAAAALSEYHGTGMAFLLVQASDFPSYDIAKYYYSDKYDRVETALRGL